MIKPLELHCFEFLSENLNASNVLSVLHLSSDKKLRDKCMKFVRANTDDVISNESFLTISHKFLTFMLRDDFLTAAEISLFKAVCYSFFFVFLSPQFVNSTTNLLFVISKKRHLKLFLHIINKFFSLIEGYKYKYF